MDKLKSAFERNWAKDSIRSECERLGVSKRAALYVFTVGRISGMLAESSTPPDTSELARYKEGITEIGEWFNDPPGGKLNLKQYSSLGDILESLSPQAGKEPVNMDNGCPDECEDCDNHFVLPPDDRNIGCQCHWKKGDGNCINYHKTGKEPEGGKHE